MRFHGHSLAMGRGTVTTTSAGEPPTGGKEGGGGEVPLPLVSPMLLLLAGAIVVAAVSFGVGKEVKSCVAAAVVVAEASSLAPLKPRI